LHNRLGLLDSLESRVLLSGFGAAPVADVQTDPAAESAYVARERFAWSATPGGSAEVGVFIQDGGSRFTANQRARIDDAIAELNRAWDAVRGVGLKLVPVLDNNLAHIVVAQDSTSGCGSRAQGVLGCAEYFVYAEPSGSFDNGDELHRFAGPEVGRHAQVTLVAGWNWYSDADAGEITTEQFDFTTVVTHELAHAVGLDHDIDDSHTDPSTYEPLNGDGESALAPTLAPGETHRKLSDGDVAELQFLYAAAASADAANSGDSAADESAGDEPTGDPSDPSDDACEASDPNDPQDEDADGDDDDCDTEEDEDAMEGEGGSPQPDVIFIEPSRADAVPLTTASTIAASLETDGSTRGQRRTASQPFAPDAIERDLPIRAAAIRLNTESRSDLNSVVTPSVLPSAFFASGAAKTESQFKAPAVAATNSRIPTDDSRTLISQVFNTLFAERIARARAAVTTGVVAGHRAESAPEFDTAGLGLTAVLIGGLWGAQASDSKRPTLQFLMDHMLDRSN
jgi:hypothetical protein